MINSINMNFVTINIVETKNVTINTHTVYTVDGFGKVVYPTGKF